MVEKEILGVITAEEFKSLLQQKKGDLSNCCYKVVEEVFLCGDFPFDIRLGYGKIGILRIEYATIKSLHFEQAQFCVFPKVFGRTNILEVFDDSGWYDQLDESYFQGNKIEELALRAQMRDKYFENSTAYYRRPTTRLACHEIKNTRKLIPLKEFLKD